MCLRPSGEKSAPAAKEAETPAAAPESRLRPLLLILFILFAVPLTLLAVLLLLIPTLLSLVLAAASIVGGCAAVVIAFGSGGFSVFADLLIVLGCAIILLALGLLFLWLFIWFVSSVIGGLIRWVIQLGRSCCYKEVAA